MAKANPDPIYIVTLISDPESLKESRRAYNNPGSDVHPITIGIAGTSSTSDSCADEIGPGGVSVENSSVGA